MALRFPHDFESPEFQGGGGGETFTDETALDLARRLQRLALIDPTDVLRRVSAGDEDILPRFATPTAEPALRSWKSIERASPRRLSLNQYQQFLEGKSPSSEIETLDVALYLDREVASYLRESRRDWWIFGGAAAVSAIVGGLASFAVLSLGWLQGIAMGFAAVAAVSAFRTAKQSRSLDMKTHHLSTRPTDYKDA